MSKQKVTFWLLCCTVLCFSVQRLEMQFRECFGYSREEFEEVLAKHNREKEAEFMEGDVFGGLLMETVSAPLIAIEGIQNQWRARTGRKTDYSFLEGRDQTRSEVTAGMGSIGTVVYQGAADITSQLTLAMLTFGRDKAMAGAMGSMYMDTMQHRKEREGVDELKAADTALLTGMADYYLGNLGYRHISRCVEEGVRKSLVRKMGESFLTGAGMALGSETGGQLIDWMLNGRLSEWGKIYNAHLDEGMSETEAFGEMVKAVGPELTVHTVAGGISGAGFAVIHMLAASKDNRPMKQETIEKTNQEGERNRNENESGSSTKLYSPVEYKGSVKVNGEVRDVSRRVYQRNDIDINYYDEVTGLTNLERMQAGKPPIGSDGKPIQLHHILQREAGPMVEIRETTHQGYYSQLHGLIEDSASFRNDPILNKQYNNFRRSYWKWRAEQIIGGQ